ncbi:MAG: hypothetical protein C1O27_002391 [Chloroflexi bacterium]|nr:MAG: hypothetical protein C1O27_002391 [Chloroflexota bacterium]
MAAGGIGLAILIGSPPSTRLKLRPTERLAILSIVTAILAAWLMGLGDGSLIHQTMMPISMLSSIWYGLWWFPRMVKQSGRLAEFPFTVYLVMALSLVVLSPAFVDVRVALDSTVRENWLYFGTTDAGLIGATAFAVASGSLLRKRFFGLRSLAFLLAVLLVVTPWVRAGLAAAVLGSRGCGNRANDAASCLLRSQEAGNHGDTGNDTSPGNHFGGLVPWRTGHIRHI